MGETTAISYAHHTWSPWLGCEKGSAGGTNCFAEAWAKRAGRERLWHGKRERTSAAYWRKPLAWNKAAKAANERRRVMVTLCDPFENHMGISDQWRADYFALIKECDGLDWLLTTKRPEHATTWAMPDSWRAGWPANAWPFATVESGDVAQARLRALATIPARVRAVSAEPLLGRLFNPGVPWWMCCDEATGRRAIDWVVVGGESGPGARTMDLDALASLVSACREARIPVYVKQDSGPRPGQWGRIPEELRVRELPGASHV